MMKTIRFLQDYTVRAAGGQSFKKGQTLSLPHRSAMHYVSRNRAEFVDQVEAEAPEPEAVTEPVKRGPGRPPKDVTNG